MGFILKTFLLIITPWIISSLPISNVEMPADTLEAPKWLRSIKIVKGISKSNVIVARQRPEDRFDKSFLYAAKDKQIITPEDAMQMESMPNLLDTELNNKMGSFAETTTLSQVENENANTNITDRLNVDYITNASMETTSPTTIVDLAQSTMGDITAQIISKVPETVDIAENNPSTIIVSTQANLLMTTTSDEINANDIPESKITGLTTTVTSSTFPTETIIANENVSYQPHPNVSAKPITMFTEMSTQMENIMETTIAGALTVTGDNIETLVEPTDRIVIPIEEAHLTTSTLDESATIIPVTFASTQSTTEEQSLIPAFTISTITPTIDDMLTTLPTMSQRSTDLVSPSASIYNTDATEMPITIVSTNLPFAMKTIDMQTASSTMNHDSNADAIIETISTIAIADPTPNNVETYVSSSTSSSSVSIELYSTITSSMMQTMSETTYDGLAAVHSSESISNMSSSITSPASLMSAMQLVQEEKTSEIPCMDMHMKQATSTERKPLTTMHHTEMSIMNARPSADTNTIKMTTHSPVTATTKRTTEMEKRDGGHGKNGESGILVASTAVVLTSIVLVCIRNLH